MHYCSTPFVTQDIGPFVNRMSILVRFVMLLHAAELATSDTRCHVLHISQQLMQHNLQEDLYSLGMHYVVLPRCGWGLITNSMAPCEPFTPF
jgi:hypothetical protein